MTTAEFWTVFVLAVVLIAYIAKCARDEKRQTAWDQHVETAPTDTTLYPAPRKLTDAPAVDRISEIIAANEAARADWSEPNRWGA